jgi:hypothetical protein
MVKLKLKQWEREKLKKLVPILEIGEYRFLGYSLDLETAELRDLLSEDGAVGKVDEYVLQAILSHYSAANSTPRTGKLIKFKDLPGGSAYELAFLQRAVEPVAQAFGENLATLLEAAKVLGGTSLSHGDVSAEVPALEGIPIVFIVWKAGEFSASANALYDESASAYLPTEDLAVLGELTSNRLRMAQQTF